MPKIFKNFVTVNRQLATHTAAQLATQYLEKIKNSISFGSAFFSVLTPTAKLFVRFH